MITRKKFISSGAALVGVPLSLQACAPTVVDPYDHHLFVSLGCALDNLQQASVTCGLKAEPQFDAATDVVTVKLVPTTVFATPLSKAITARQSTRGPFDGKALSTAELDTPVWAFAMRC